MASRNLAAVAALLVALLVATSWAPQASATPCPSRKSCSVCVDVKEKSHASCYWKGASETCVPESEVVEPDTDDVPPGGECPDEEVDQVDKEKGQMSEPLQIVSHRRSQVLDSGHQEIPEGEQAMDLQMNLQDMPLEILVMIAEYLRGNALAHFGQACKHLNNVQLSCERIKLRETVCARDLHSVGFGYLSWGELPAKKIHVQDKFHKYHIGGQEMELLHVSFTIKNLLSMTMTFGHDSRPEIERLFSMSNTEATRTLQEHTEALQNTHTSEGLLEHLGWNGPVIVLSSSSSVTPDNINPEATHALVPGRDADLVLELSSGWDETTSSYTDESVLRRKSSSKSEALIEPFQDNHLMVKRYLVYKSRSSGKVLAVVFAHNNVFHVLLSTKGLKAMLCAAKEYRDK